MTSISAYSTAKGTRYRVRYRDPDRGQTDKRGFKTKREAQSWAAHNLVKLERGQYTKPSAGRITVAELAEEWLTKKKAATAPSHYRALESTWRNHVAPDWADTQVSKITTAAVESWIANKQRYVTQPDGTEKLTPSATHMIRMVGILQGILDEAVKQQRIYTNAARGVSNLPKRKRTKHIYLTAHDVRTLAESTTCQQHRLIVYTLAYCGLRWSELTALQVDDLNVARKRLLVARSAPEGHVKDTKGGETRSVPLPGFLAEELSAWTQGKERDALIFPGKDGEFMPRPKTETGWFDKAVAAAGITRVTPHDLRHTCASLAVSAGCNVLVLQRMLGHKDAAMTLNRYADLFDGDLDALGDAFNTLHSQAIVGKSVGTNA